MPTRRRADETINVSKPRLYLYNNGDECSEITGGWRQCSHYYNSTSMFGTITRYSDRIKIGGTPIGSWIYGLATNNAVDLTGYTECHIIMTASYGGKGFSAAVSDNDSGYGYGYNRIASKGKTYPTANVKTELVIDISGTRIAENHHFLIYSGEAASSTYGEFALYEVYLSNSTPQKPTPATAQYTELEYIQSSGGQYINTGVNIDTETIVEYEAYLSSLEMKYFNGALKDAHYYGFRYQDASTVRWHCYNVADYALALQAAKWYHIKQDGDTLYVDDVNYGSTTPSYYDWAIPLYLFARNNAGVADGCISGKMRYCKITRDGVLVRDMVPVKRNSDGVLGMYDKVNSIFYTNTGTGTFTAGPARTHTELEYIQSQTDGLQYIDTKLSGGHSADIDFQLTGWGTDPWYYHTIYGSQNSEDPMYAVYFRARSSTKILEWGVWGTSGRPDLSSYDSSARHVVKIDAQTTVKTLKIDGTSVYTAEISATPNAHTLWLFGINHGDTLSQAAIARLYSATFYSDIARSQRTRDYLPVKRDDDEVCLYDRVTGIYFLNQGSGTFIAGPEKT